MKLLEMAFERELNILQPIVSHTNSGVTSPKMEVKFEKNGSPGCPFQAMAK